MKQTLLYTTFFAALFMVLSLFVMDLFSFLKWSPIGWSKDVVLFDSTFEIIQWIVLFLSLFLLFVIIYMFMSLLVKIHPSIVAILISFIGLFIVEWLIHSEKTFGQLLQSISIPLFAVCAIVLRFISGTVSFHKKEKNSNA